jgi:hypothetical protein
MSFLAIIVPEAGTNYVLNPSAEATGNFAAHNGATVTQSTTYARFGVYSYSVVLGATNRGINLTLSALANAIHNVSVYVRGTITGTLQASLNAGSNYNAMSIVGGVSGGWVRYQVQISAAQANGSTALIIRDTANDGTIYADAVQVEQTSGYYTTYLDGDRPGAFVGAYRWSGLRHGSTSTRSAQERGGGRERDLYDDYGIGLWRREYRGLGIPPIVNNTQPFALQPGDAFQNYKIQTRTIDLKLEIEGSSYQNMHQKRQDLIDLIKPGLTRDSQPFTLVFKIPDASGGIDKKAYARFRYQSGGELVNLVGAMTEQPVLQLLAVDPLWQEDNQETAALDFQDTL